jgi:NAD(P)-dependent dehydrogenase (short-subunit alcohol dehydrogenase family)
MGLAAAETIAQEGGNLALLARGADQLATVVKDLQNRHGVDVSGHAADASRTEAVEGAVAAALDRHGGIDGMAVVAGPMREYGDLASLTDDAWDFYYQNHLMITVRTCRALLPHLVERGGGAIVTTGAYSVRAQKPAVVHLTAMKTAIVSVTKNIAKTYGPAGVRANCVCPGMIDTDLVPVDRADLAARYGTDSNALYRYAETEWGMKLALGRVGQPAEVGALMAMLLSDRIGYVTGATVNIDGGTDF